ncbi:MAG TPA: LacI family DNA-binding transcriptional regulator [Rhizobiaceae bacterium]|nr:LacI family DNA-binding transcriptional regulator [Rhizobiaceae bacterium]
MTGSGRRRATISQVAEEANVARSTVSRAFTQPERLSDETVKHVLEVANRLGYTPNPVAQALSTGQSKNIALIVPDVANPFFPPLIQAAQRKAEEYDYCVFLGDSDEQPERENQLVERFTHQVAGLILVSSRLSEAQVREHARRRPLVLVNQDFPEMLRVLINSGAGVAQAVEHLAELGHRHIVYLSGPATSWANRQRRTALRQAAKHHGIEVSAVAAHKPTHEAGRGSAHQILATGATAAFAFDDLLAQGLLAGLADAGISVPRQFSVIGCDDVLGATTYPPLTTVSNRCVEVAEIAVSLLMDALRTRAASDVRHVLDTHLVIRGTTAAPNPALHRRPAGREGQVVQRSN